jgi:hypothetical protein
MRRSKTTTHGERGGEGATRGRRLLRYRIVSANGTVYTKGAYFPCVVATVVLDPKFPPLVQVWATRDLAERMMQSSIHFPDSACELTESIELLN